MPQENKPETNEITSRHASSLGTDLVSDSVAESPLHTTTSGAQRGQLVDPAEIEHLPFSMTDDEIREFEMHPESRGEFKVRPISAQWRHAGRRAAYKTAVCNVAYIWRDSSAVDSFGKMPSSFDQRAYELRAAGLMLPNSAPLWAWDGYRIWAEADANTEATGDPTAASAWHVVGEIPISIAEEYWEWLVTGFIERELSGRGAAVSWAIHALEGADGQWITKPHFHMIVSLRYWRHREGKFGKRHPNWLVGKKAQDRLRAAWFWRCRNTLLTRR